MRLYTIAIGSHYATAAKSKPANTARQMMATIPRAAAFDSQAYDSRNWQALRKHGVL